MKGGVLDPMQRPKSRQGPAILPSAVKDEIAPKGQFLAPPWDQFVLAREIPISIKPIGLNRFAVVM